MNGVTVSVLRQFFFMSSEWMPFAFCILRAVGDLHTVQPILQNLYIQLKQS